jgi:hypothetical protein
MWTWFMWLMTEKNNGLCGQGNEPSGSVRAENIVDLMRNQCLLQKECCYMEFLEYNHKFSKCNLFAERWIMYMMRGSAAAQTARRRLLNPNTWVQPWLRVLVGIVALTKIYFEYSQHSPVSHHPIIAQYSLKNIPWGVRQPLLGSTFSHPQVL